MLQAHAHGARRIDAVELNPQVVDLVRQRYDSYAGGLYSRIAQVHVAEARGFLAAGSERYDLIHVSLLDSFSASSAGMHALAENYLYTAEALQDALRRLQPGGLLAITRWVALPPRDALKLFGAACRCATRTRASPIPNNSEPLQVDTEPLVQQEFPMGNRYGSCA